MNGLGTFSLDSGEDERCTRCEVLPKLAFGAGRLHMRVPVAYTLHKARAALEGTGWAVTEDGQGVFSIDVPDRSYEAYCSVLRSAFTSIELAAIRAVFIDEGHTPGLADYLEADSLARLVAKSRAGALVQTLASGMLTAAYQPICDAQTLEIYGYEGLLRFEPGSPINGPEEFFNIARGSDMLPQVDLAARRTIIDCASKYSFDGHLFINFMPSSIYDVKTCLRTTILALDAFGVAHDRVVFEVVESDEVEDFMHLTNIMNAYRQAGFKVALDDLGSGFASLNLLHRLRPDFVKLDIELVRDVDRDPFKAMLAGKLIEAGNALGLMVIAEGVETKGELAWMRKHGADLIQGFLLARPAAVPIRAIEHAAAYRG